MTTKSPLVLILALAGLSMPAVGDAVLDVHNATLTSYLPTGVTAEQDARPLAAQRAVNLDGTGRAGNGLGLSIAANPFERAHPGMMLGDVRLDTGTYMPTEVDLSLPGPGLVRWVIGRTFNGDQVVGGSHHDSNGYQGYNWFQMSQPQLVRVEGATDDDDTLWLLFGNDRFVEFDRDSGTSNEYKAKNGAAGVIQHVTGSPDTYVYHDGRGTRAYFFGGNTASNRANWQLWKVVDPAGNTAYVGHPSTSSTAVTNGYNGDGSIAMAVDAADRRCSYSYSTINSVSRLTEVKVETKTGGSWGGTPTGVTEVARVTYTYYTSDETGKGKTGDLKLVTVRTSLPDSGSTLSSGIYAERSMYYRYYDQSWADSDGRRGEPHQVKMVVDWEGTRAYPGDYLTASDGDLKPYAGAYFEYVSGSDYRVKKVFFNGDCGCSGGNNGVHTLAYGLNGSFSGGSGYDTDWYSRTVVTRPDGVYLTQYFDEVGQTLSKVVTAGDPATANLSSVNDWEWVVVRDGSGLVVEVHSPAATIDYDHSDGTFTPQTTGDRLTQHMDRSVAGDLSGLLLHRLHSDDGGSTQYYDSTAELTSATLTVGDVDLVRPFVQYRWVYTVEDDDEASHGGSPVTGAFETQTAYTFWTGAAALMPKRITTTNPVVTTANNGSNAATTSDAWLRQDGTVAWSRAADGIYT